MVISSLLGNIWSSNKTTRGWRETGRPRCHDAAKIWLGGKSKL